MSAGGQNPDEGGVTDALRAAIERTLAATAPAAAQTRERAGELLDELARRGQEARAEIAKRGQDARDELSRRGHGAHAELSRQIEGLEKRLASIEEVLRPGGGESGSSDDSNPQAED
jgi:polyhydroxyalkanoate synthesis regulator phasin